MQKLCDALPESDYLMGKDVYVDGFSYFNRVEEDILETALRQGNCLTVTLLGDESDPQLFQNALRQRDRLKRMAALVHARCEVETLVSKNDGPLGYLERCFFDGEEPWQGEEPPIRLYQAETAFSEAEYVSACVRRLARQEIGRAHV